jgi:hypothetical protein
MTLKRYYADDGKVDKSLDLSELSQDVHAMYTHWVAGNGHRRDFTQAMEHAAEMIYTEHLASGLPSLDGDLPGRVALKLATPRKSGGASTPLRFYDEDCALNPRLDTELHIPALAPHYVSWVQKGYALRDFVCAVRDVSKVVVYDHELALTLLGLGGAKDAQTFMTTPYKG